jgi:hypothetical protein
MALSQPSGMTITTNTITSRLQLPSLSQQSSMHPFYTATTLSSSTSDLKNLINLSEPLSPRTLYAQSFDRPSSARSLPSSKRFRKNMKEMTGFGTTEEEFEALPIAVRRKVRGDIFITSNSSRSRASCWWLRLHSKRVCGKLESSQQSSCRDARSFFASFNPKCKIGDAHTYFDCYSINCADTREGKACWASSLPTHIVVAIFSDDQMPKSCRMLHVDSAGKLFDCQSPPSPEWRCS